MKENVYSSLFICLVLIGFVAFKLASPWEYIVPIVCFLGASRFFYIWQSLKKTENNQNFQDAVSELISCWKECANQISTLKEIPKNIQETHKKMDDLLNAKLKENAVLMQNSMKLLTEGFRACQIKLENFPIEAQKSQKEIVNLICKDISNLYNQYTTQMLNQIESQNQSIKSFDNDIKEKFSQLCDSFKDIPKNLSDAIDLIEGDLKDNISAYTEKLDDWNDAVTDEVSDLKTGLIDQVNNLVVYVQNANSLLCSELNKIGEVVKNTENANTEIVKQMSAASDKDINALKKLLKNG